VLQLKIDQAISSANRQTELAMKSLPWFLPAPDDSAAKPDARAVKPMPVRW